MPNLTELTCIELRLDGPLENNHHWMSRPDKYDRELKIAIANRINELWKLWGQQKKREKNKQKEAED